MSSVVKVGVTRGEELGSSYCLYTGDGDPMLYIPRTPLGDDKALMLANMIARMLNIEEVHAPKSPQPYEDMPPATDWMLPAHCINKLQQASLVTLTRRCRHAHHTDIVVRINGEYEVYQADWFKSLIPVEGK